MLSQEELYRLVPGDLVYHNSRPTWEWIVNSVKIYNNKDMGPSFLDIEIFCKDGVTRKVIHIVSPPDSRKFIRDTSDLEGLERMHPDFSPLKEICMKTISKCLKCSSWGCWGCEDRRQDFRMFHGVRKIFIPLYPGLENYDWRVFSISLVNYSLSSTADGEWNKILSVFLSSENSRDYMDKVKDLIVPALSVTLKLSSIKGFKGFRGEEVLKLLGYAE
jgi:hypothetical protein